MNTYILIVIILLIITISILYVLQLKNNKVQIKNTPLQSKKINSTAGGVWRSGNRNSRRRRICAY